MQPKCRQAGMYSCASRYCPTEVLAAGNHAGAEIGHSPAQCM
ncbi:hypothetical protein L838_5417 [Mycobacterium avium MAV_120709_2344]|nr:hypothetical protein L838_5417 [Mycobacterium avium MAV_120709_2344]